MGSDRVLLDYYSFVSVCVVISLCVSFMVGHCVSFMCFFSFCVSFMCFFSFYFVVFSHWEFLVLGYVDLGSV